MKKIGAIVCVFLVALAIFGCKAKNKLDEKSVEDRLSAYILHEMQLSGGYLLEFTMKAADPKNSDVTWTGVATYSYEYDGSDSQNVDISVKYLADTNSVSWWYTVRPEDPKTVPLTGDIVFEEEGRMMYESSYGVGEPESSVSKTTQSTYSEPTVTLSKVEQKGSKFTLFDSSKREITHIDMPGRELVGWGNDFFLTKSKDNTFRSYNLRCTEIGSITVGNVESVTFDNEGFILKQKGLSPRKYKKNGQSR